MEVAPGIHRIEGRFAGRYLFQHVLVGERIALVDSGVPSTPHDLVFPYLERIGRDPSEIAYLVTTHPDADHLGGNAAVKRAAPACRILCHELDVHWITDPDALVAERYDGFREHGITNTPEALSESRALCGDPTPVDLELVGGEWIELGKGLRVQVLHTPGHSEGHLSVWEPISRTLVIADAAMGKALPFVDGSPALAPTYTHPTPYRATARRLRAFGAEQLLTAHFPRIEGHAVSAFLDETIEQADRIEELVRADTSEVPDLVERVDRELGPLPPETVDTWAQPIIGQLREDGRASA